MAVGYDTSASGTGTTLAITLGASATALIVFVSQHAGSTTAVTYNGVSMTLVRSAVSGGDPRIYCYKLANPSTGASYNVSVTASGHSSIGIVAISFTGTDTTDPVEVSTTQTSYASNYSATINGTTSGSMVVDGIFASTLGAANAGQTSRQTVTIGSPYVMGVSTEPGNGNITTGWTNNLNYVCLIQASIKEGGASTTGTVAVSQGAQTVSSAATVAVAGTVAKSQGAQTLTSSATVAVTGSLAQSQGAQTLASSGVVSIEGTLAQPQQAQSTSSAAAVAVSGSANLIQQGDTVTAAVGDVITGTAVLTQGAQSVSSAGNVAITATVAGTLGSTISATGNAVLPATSVRISSIRLVTKAPRCLILSSGSRLRMEIKRPRVMNA